MSRVMTLPLNKLTHFQWEAANLMKSWGEGDQTSGGNVGAWFNEFLKLATRDGQYGLGFYGPSYTDL
ncbi:hypothetical protein CK203_080327 [Vitis vinifera]|uniref:Uncharacterized protein n=1 Tax=Vitis vinifera TaxID=29760 RepID=A0A438CNG9_VITVI|nr:hypothetical protein CK203_080327 [Vitis vinifera]